MEKKNKIQLFQNQSVRTHWDKEQEKWYFSVQAVAVRDDKLQVIPEKKLKST